MDPMLSQILAQFRLVGTPISCERYGFGHINVTYLVVTDQGPRYILQKINDHVFPHVDELQHNIAAVTAYLRKQTDEKYGVLTLIPTLTGETYYHTKKPATGGSMTLSRAASVCRHLRRLRTSTRVQSPLVPSSSS